MTSLAHEERALIDRLFDTTNVTPEQWDQLFAHMRTCPGCAEHYAVRKQGLGASPALENELSTAEAAAMTRVLVQRAERSLQPKTARERLRSWPSLAAVAGVAAAALLLARPGGEDAPTAVKGGPDVAAGLTVRCATLDRPQGSKMDGAGCAVSDTLVFETLATRALGALAVSVLLVGPDMSQLDYQWARSEPDKLIVVRSDRARAGTTRAFVLWSTAKLEQSAIDAALMKVRAHAGAGDLDLDLPGVVAHRLIAIPLRSLHGR